MLKLIFPASEDVRDMGCMCVCVCWKLVRNEEFIRWGKPSMYLWEKNGDAWKEMFWEGGGVEAVITGRTCEGREGWGKELAWQGRYGKKRDRFFQLLKNVGIVGRFLKGQMIFHVTFLSFFPFPFFPSFFLLFFLPSFPLYFFFYVITVFVSVLQPPVIAYLQVCVDKDSSWPNFSQAPLRPLPTRPRTPP